MLSKHHLTYFKADELIEFNYSPTVIARKPGGKAFVLIKRLLFEVLVCHEFHCWDEDLYAEVESNELHLLALL